VIAMEMRLKQIEDLVQNECLLMGLPFEAISDGKKAARMLFRMTGCFSSAVQGGVGLAESFSSE
jgi:hypothetical protein